jgi:hypothetical protein
MLISVKATKPLLIKASEILKRLCELFITVLAYLLVLHLVVFHLQSEESTCCIVAFRQWTVLR